MIPEEQGLRPAGVVSAADSALESPPGIRFWQGIDPEAWDTEVFLARARCEPGTRIAPHVHSEDTVAYLVDGHAVFRSGPGLDEVHHMAAGDWLFVPAGMVHAEETPAHSHGEFLFARNGKGGITTYLDDPPA